MASDECGRDEQINNLMQIYKPKKTLVFFVELSCVIVAVGLFLISDLCDQSILALLSTVPFILGIFFLIPILKNQTVEVLSDCIVISSFGKRVTLDVADLHEIVTRQNGYISFCFYSDKSWVQITPLCYHSGEILEEELERLFGSSHSTGNGQKSE